MRFVIEKVLTHNIVLAKNDSKDYMLIGKGIGFNVKKGECVDSFKVSNFYLVKNTDRISDYEKLLLNTDESTIIFTEKAISHAEEKLNHKFNETIHISLLDHINFAIYRSKHKLEVGSFFSSEYYLMYSELYDIAKEMINIINEACQVELPSSEVGAIIMHMHAAMQDEDVSQSAFKAQIISFSVDYISEKLGKQFSSNSLAKARFVTHLKFAIQRNQKKMVLNNPLSDVIEQNYPDVFKISSDLCEQIVNQFGISFENSEKSYLALHIMTLKNN